MEDIWNRAERYRKERDETIKELIQVEIIMIEMIKKSDEYLEMGDDETSDLLNDFISKLAKATGNIYNG